MDYRKHRTQPLFTLVFYYIIMLFGAIAAQRRTNTESPSSIARPLSAVLLIVTVYYSLKIYILHSANPIYDVQLCIPILLTLFSIYMFRLFERLSNIGTKKTAAIVNYIASLTLDIYIVQFVIMGYFTRYTFPLDTSVPLLQSYWPPAY